MKSEKVFGNGVAYTRITKPSARMVFEEGWPIYVMTTNRNPVNSLTAAHEYKKGCIPYTNSLHTDTIETFDDVLDDFSTWLMTDGYGHKPDPYKATKRFFSYWMKY